MAEYGKIKSVKVIHHQNGGTENKAMICQETEMEAQRGITEINRYKGCNNRTEITGNVCFSKEREIQEAITEIIGYEDWNAEVYRNVYNKNSTRKISSRYEDKQKHNRNRKKKKEIRKKEKWYQGNKKGYYKQKYRLTRNK